MFKSNIASESNASIGGVLLKDYLLLLQDELQPVQLQDRLSKYSIYLKEHKFHEFRIMVPYETPELILQTIQNFINQQNIKGAIRNYLPINNQTKFDKELKENPNLAFKSWLCVLPSPDYRYESLRKRIWEMAKDGKALMILMPERVNEWRGKTSYLKRMHLKGASFAMSASSNFRWGFWHKKNLKEIHENKLVTMWITPQIYDVHSSEHQRDAKIKLDIITSIDTMPNDL